MGPLIQQRVFVSPHLLGDGCGLIRSPGHLEGQLQFFLGVGLILLLQFHGPLRNRYPLIRIGLQAIAEGLLCWIVGNQPANSTERNAHFLDGVLEVLQIFGGRRTDVSHSNTADARQRRFQVPDGDFNVVGMTDQAFGLIEAMNRKRRRNPAQAQQR